MKTIKQIEQEIYYLKLEMSDLQKISLRINKSAKEKTESNQAKTKMKKISSKITLYKLCLAYIKTDPSPDFVKNEKDRITNRINMALEKYSEPTWLASIERRKFKKEYEKSMEIPKLRKQLSTLYYLLK